jgi:hypothetical protein
MACFLPSTVIQRGTVRTDILLRQASKPTRRATTVSAVSRDSLWGIPTQVVVPSISWAAVLHDFAGTIFVVAPPSAALAKPVAEVGICAATP